MGKSIIFWPPPWPQSSLTQRAAGVLWAVLMVPVVAIFSIIVLLSLPLQKWLARRAGPRMSRAAVASTIESFLEGAGGPWDWDEFLSVPIGEPDLDKIRLRCAHLGEEFPPDRSGRFCGEGGIQVLRELVSQLRGSNA
jgi:hypothetical protein